ncbi:MAG: ABC transporter ATP-binding protein [Candidatus Zixiibacteriota bacterium]
MNIIDVIELTKVYNPRMKKGGIVALNDVSLSVQRGEIFGLLGPNGAGKTTLFKILLGIVSATAGTALLDGMKSSDPHSREKVGYLPENHRFPPHLTGYGLLKFTGRLYGMSESDIDSRLDILLNMVGMERWGDTPIKKYSKGMSQRVGLAQALICDPDILFLDEPTDGIDPVGKIEIRNIMAELKNKGKTIIVNSHLLAEIENIADRVAILNHGRLIKTGTVSDLTTRGTQYQIDADFGNLLIDIPSEIGKRLSITTSSMVIEMSDSDKINDLIDLLRIKKVSIRAVQPLKVSLEQSFIETVAAEPPRQREI